jgi:NAD(P)-dependent dehydrogenase (short-subunit alcohol dehydrogenase family)
MKDLNGKVAVITGGGSGLGREFALCCARRGMKLVLADVDEKGMAETVRLAQQEVTDVQSATIRVDVSKLEQVEALAALAKERFGGAHVVFNNAGVSVGGPLWEHTAADWHWVMGVNVYGVAFGIKAFVPLMLAQGEGHIVNTASAAGWLNAPGGGIYNASKHAVVAISETLAFDLKDAGGDNIGVTVLCPAYFPTPIVDSARNRPAELAETAPMTEARKLREERIRYAVQHGRISAAEIAEMTLQAVERDQFYVFPHRKVKALIKARAEAADREVDPFDTLAGR